MLTAMAGLEAGAISEHTAFSCGGSYSLGSATFHCWKRGGHGGLRLRDAMKQSCDVYFYQTAVATGIERMAAMGRRFSFGGLTGIDLPNEKPALMPDTKWKRETFKDKFHAGELAIIGIGQGYVIASPLQLAVYVARLVNGGHAVVPRVVRAPKELIGNGPKSADGRFPSLGLNPKHLKFLTEAMAGVVNEPGGTALRAKIDDKLIAMGGKTGTSQVRRITAAERARGVIKNEDLPWEKRDHALFVAFAPVHAPRFACSVVVEHGGGGGAVAAPIARDLLTAVQRKFILKMSSAPDRAADPRQVGGIGSR
jgi:penicillin-binding protein 2